MDKQTQALMFSSVNPEWGTPQDLYDELDEKYNFTIDLCASPNNFKHKNYISVEENFLSMKVSGVGFLNPPYNKPEIPCILPHLKCKKKTCEKRGFHIDEYVPGQIDFVEHVYRLAKYDLLTTVALLPARTDTKIFHNFIWDKTKNRPREGVELDFLEGRIKFEDVDGNKTDPAPFPSMIVVFNKGLVI